MPKISIKKKIKKLPSTKSSILETASASEGFDPDLIRNVDKINVKPSFLEEQHIITAQKASKPDESAGFDSGFTIDTYIAAAYIFAHLSQNQKEESLKYELPASEGEKVLLQNLVRTLNKRYIFDLVHTTLKYKTLFEEILDESNFFSKHAFSDDQNALLIVTLVNTNSRKWKLRPTFTSDLTSPYAEDFRLVEKAILTSKIKLAAAVAKKRVKNQSQSINYFLPDELKAQEQNRGIVPISAWSVDGPANALMKSDLTTFTEQTDFQSILNPGSFKFDKNLDTIVHFSGFERDTIHKHPAVLSKKLVIQDKSSVLAVDSVIKLANALEKFDVLLTELTSGWTCIQLALKLKHFSTELKRKSDQAKFLFGKPNFKSLGGNDTEEEDPNSQCYVHTFFNGSDSAFDMIKQRLADFGVESLVKIRRGRFVQAGLTDPEYEKVKIVLISTMCSRTSVADPIELLIEESTPDFSMNMLTNIKPVSDGKGTNAVFAAGHLTQVKHAMTVIPSANAIVYLTRSVSKNENQDVINRALQEQPSKSQLAWKLSPPVTTLNTKDISTSKGNFFSIPPSEYENGCFLAVLSRKLTLDKDPSNELMKKAAMQGLILPDEEPEKPGTRSSTHARVDTNLAKRKLATKK